MVRYLYTLMITRPKSPLIDHKPALFAGKGKVGDGNVPRRTVDQGTPSHVSIKFISVVCLGAHACVALFVGDEQCVFLYRNECK